MMTNIKHKKLKLIAILLLGIGLTGLQAQTALIATGGIALGSGGSVSYSIGQVVYHQHISFKWLSSTGRAAAIRDFGSNGN